MHLRYDYFRANVAGENRHAEIVMCDLGIKYTHATSQSMLESWWFWNCTNIPNVLPNYLSELKTDPYSQIGYGLTKEIADEIEQRRRNHA